MHCKHTRPYHYPESELARFIEEELPGAPLVPLASTQRPLLRLPPQSTAQPGRAPRLGTSDPDEAEIAFHRYVAQHDELRAADPGAITVAAVIERYWLHHGERLAGADVQRRALRYCLEGLGDFTLAELTPSRQQIFVEQLRGRGYGDPYIKRTLGAAGRRFRLGLQARRADLGPVHHHGRPRR